MKEELAIALISGGIDSGVTALLASMEYRLALLHFSYGQRSEGKERISARRIAKYLKAESFLELALPFFATLGGSSLTDRNIPIPTEEIPQGIIPSTYVPFRNGIMLSIASAWAEIISAKHIFIGAVEEDSSGYPDTTESFLIAMERAINLGRKPSAKLKLHFPVIHKRKWEIIRLGAEHAFPFEYTWSCYDGKAEACGECPSCRLRREAFKLAGIEDPIPYAK